MPGTGIGLALARSLAELHGGTLSMDATTDENLFRLVLPVKHARTMAMEPAENPGQSRKPTMKAGPTSPSAPTVRPSWWWKTA